MSAFLINQKTIANLAETLCSVLNNRQNYIYYDLSKLAPLLNDCKTYPHGDVNSTKLGQMLLNMNIEALNNRYPQNPWWKSDLTDDYNNFDNGENLLKTNKFQLLKSLHCYLYQCSEGNIPDNQLYIALREFDNQIQSDIISHLPDYENAVWG